MTDTIIVGLLSLLGTCIGSWGGLKLMSYRIEQLEKKVDKHNCVIERVYDLEKRDAVIEEEIENTKQKIDDMRHSNG